MSGGHEDTNVSVLGFWKFCSSCAFFMSEHLQRVLRLGTAQNKDPVVYEVSTLGVCEALPSFKVVHSWSLQWESILDYPCVVSALVPVHITDKDREMLKGRGNNFSSQPHS